MDQNGEPYNLYIVQGNAVLIGQPLSSMSYPSQKVVVHDQNAWYFGPRQPYCTHSEARLPMLMGDGSADVRATKDSNLGWQPNNPANPNATIMSYVSPPAWQPPSLSPSGDLVYGQFRWTRNGIAGRDFGGPEAH